MTRWTFADTKSGGTSTGWIAILGLVAATLASPPPAAWAGTKYLANIVPLSTSSPTLSSKSKILFKEQGLIKVKLKDVVAGPGAGTEVTTDQSFDNGVLTGDEYIVVLIGSVPAIDQDFEFNMVIEPRNGSGSVKTDATAIFDLIPGGLVRSVVVRGTEVHGPLGVPNVTGCQSNLNSAGGVSLPPAPNPCVGGAFIGQAGVEVP